MRLVPKILPRSDAQHQAEIERALIRREAQIGGQLFGPLPIGHRREFFCLDEHTWIWHEEWMQGGRRQTMTTRYHVRPGGVLKLQAGQSYQPISDQESQNIRLAVQLYRQRVIADYQQSLQAA